MHLQFASYQQLASRQQRLNLNPGDWYVGAEYEILYTLLGSCVSLAAWHPQLKLGGLCHFILPSMPGNINNHRFDHLPDAGRYGNSALALMKLALMRYAPLTEFKLGLFGGGATLSHYDIGKKNIFTAQQWLQCENLVVHNLDVEGNVSRSLTMIMSSGVIDIKRYVMPTT